VKLLFDQNLSHKLVAEFEVHEAAAFLILP
jgi:hypothetical protein